MRLVLLSYEMMFSDRRYLRAGVRSSSVTSGRDYVWLPEHQLHVAWTLAHADDLIARAGDVLFDYVKPPGPLHLQTVPDGLRFSHQVVTR